MLAISLSGSARADEPGLDETRASGDWGGAREWLRQRGLLIGIDYAAESFASGTGGGPSVTYRGTLDLSLLVAFEPLGLWKGGTAYLLAQNGHGNGPSAALGLQMALSSLEAPPLTQLSEAWYEQRAWGDRVRVKLGKQDGNTDFAVSRGAVNFLHSSFGVPPNMPLPSFPVSALGALVAFEPAPWIDVSAAVYDGSVPTRAAQLGLALPREDPLLVAQATLQTDSVPAAFAASAGAWRHEADVEIGNRTFDVNYGAFAVAEARFGAAGAALPTPLQLFARAAWAPRDRNAVDWYVGGGLTYRGFAESDSVGLGSGHVTMVGLGRTQPGSESFVELFYEARVARWLEIEPDVQLIVQRGEPERATLVAGVRARLGI